MYLSSPPLQVLAALQDDSLINSEECKHLWYHTDVILVQSLNSKSPEEIRRTATVLRIFQFKNESEYLRGKHRLHGNSSINYGNPGDMCIHSYPDDMCIHSNSGDMPVHKYMHAAYIIMSFTVRPRLPFLICKCYTCICREGGLALAHLTNSCTHQLRNIVVHPICFNLYCMAYLYPTLRGVSTVIYYFMLIAIIIVFLNDCMACIWELIDDNFSPMSIVGSLRCVYYRHSMNRHSMNLWTFQTIYTITP